MTFPEKTKVSGRIADPGRYIDRKKAYGLLPCRLALQVEAIAEYLLPARSQTK